ncbi:hypothetical protein PG997_011917 [Apiospora hydei]|uniref:AAA+ ATPase domain-containing protein n=1 Tax=Apiospora hydei TaxID=1337664 RepID=A0ABR1V1U3_9PEZI
MSKAVKAPEDTEQPVQGPSNETSTQDTTDSHDETPAAEAVPEEDLPSPSEPSDVETNPRASLGSSSVGTVSPNPESHGVTLSIEEAPCLLDFSRLERGRPCEVERILMEEWRTRGLPPAGGRLPGISSDPLPVIQVFYRNIPSVVADPDSITSREDFKEIHKNSSGLEKPQRVKINSPLLIKDLESICGLQLPNQPYVQIPPYKREQLLIHNWPGIQSALQRMQEELKSMEAGDQQDTGATAPLSPTSEQSQYASVSQQQNKTETTQGPRNDDAENDEKWNADKPDLVHEGSDHSVAHSSSSSELSDDDILNDADHKLSIRISHLQVLVDFIKTGLGHLIGLMMKIEDATLETISFEEVYHLYAPGDLIINRSADVDHLHQIYAVTGGRVRLGRYESANRPPGPIADDADDAPDAGVGTWTDVVIDCFRMRWDGIHLGPFRLTHRVRHYVGEKAITDLDFYPVRFRKNHEDICGDLENRGKKVLEYHGHMKYEGLTVAASGQQSPAGPQFGPPRFPEYAPALTFESITGASEGGKEIESDVYIDMKAYHQTLPPPMRVFGKLRRVRPSPREVIEALTSLNLSLDYHRGDHDVDEAKSDEFMAQCFYLINPRTPDEIQGKQLVCLFYPVWVDITLVERIDKGEEARTRGWKDLVINENYRRLLESLVNNHMSPAEQKSIKSQIGEGVPTAQIDLIQGKGRGLVILLHGPPGTGKTSTAEAIAAYTGKPLYAITCGDIGLSPDNVETNLLKHTRLAEKWGCVLLLDEADVFLARRGWDDVHRNALVSVFLRRLEYYSGILFLTTNIVGLIDEAFKSRIHVALRYDTIDYDATERIWQNLLRRIKRDNRNVEVKITFEEEELLDFAMEHFERHEKDESTWNARQIRNAFSTAIAMGQFDRLERIRREEMSPDEVLASGNRSLMTIHLTKRNFLKIADIADDFEHYINAVRGDDAWNALNNQQRDDFFMQQRTPPRKRYNRPTYDDDHAPASGRRRGHQSSSQPSRSSYKGKAAVNKPANRDEEEKGDSEMEENRHNSDVRSRRMRRSRKVPSDDEADRFDEE